MATSLDRKLNNLPKQRRQKIRARAEQLIAEEMSLRDLRLAHQLTQEKMAELLQIRQENVSRLEKRSDLLLSTLREFVKAMGGELHLVAEFPDRPPVILSGFQDLDQNQGVSERSSHPTIASLPTGKRDDSR